MGKKGKVNKLARMSDEERARYLQHRADLEEEGRRRKRELIARFIKNKLEKEEAYSRINTAKLNQMWRYTLRRVKCRQMALDIEGLRDSFNYVVARKDRLISALTASIGDSDDQHRRAFQAHTETISDFLDIGAQRLDKLQAEYEHQKQMLLETWDRRELQISDGQERAELHLKLITYIQGRDFQEDRKKKEQERATARNDARLEHEDDMHVLRRPKTLEIESYWATLRDVYAAYTELHHPILGHYQLLREKDVFYQRDIARNDRQIYHATKIVLTLQREYIRMVNTMDGKVKRMNDHREELARRYWLMKKESKVDRGRGDDQLVVLVDASQAVIEVLTDWQTLNQESLEGAKKKLDKIQQLALICSKYEKESDLQAPTDNQNDKAEAYENLDEAMINEWREYSKMGKFLLKMNHVNVQNVCLKAEKGKLSRENVQLKHYIKRYLTELALKTEKARPCSVKLQSEMKPEVLKLARPVTCIEGALSNAVMHEKRMKIQQKRNKENAIRSYPRIQNWMQV